MVSSSYFKLRPQNQRVITSLVIGGFLLVEATMGWYASALDPGILAAVMLALTETALVLWKVEAGVVVLGFLSMVINPTIFDIQGRGFNTLHLLAGMIIVAWLLRKILLERNLRLPKTQLNPALRAFVVVWIITWLAGYVLWDGRVPTAHRQPLFFVAELGQFLLFVGVFWSVTDVVKSGHWINTISAAMILGKVLTPLLQGHWLFIEYPIVLALTCSFLAFGKIGKLAKLLLLLALAVFVWDLLEVNRIPIYLACAAVVLTVAWFKDRRVFVLLLVVSAVMGIVFIIPLWHGEASVSSRATLAKLAWSVFQEHPILGIGPTHYRSYAIIYQRDISYGWNTVESGMLLPHNWWLYHLVDTGVVGALAMLWLVAVMYWEPFTLLRETKDACSKVLTVSVLSCLTGVLIQSIGGHAAHFPTYDMNSVYMVPVWILMGLATARRNILTSKAGCQPHRDQ